MTIPVAPVAPVAPVESVHRDGPQFRYRVHALRLAIAFFLENQKRNTRESKDANREVSVTTRKGFLNAEPKRETGDSASGGEPIICGGHGPAELGAHCAVDGGASAGGTRSGGPTGGLPEGHNGEAGVFLAA